jgi:ubiquinone/menaquinone biosynthesis C-methylase UbiE
MAASNQDYEYRGLLAETWDLFRGNTSGWADRFFFREFIEQHSGRVLDVGCGTGRLLLDYLSDGIDIEGVDNSPQMLELCRQKGSDLGLTPTLYQQSMQELDLPHRYRVIIVPSSSFQLVTDVDDARQAMDNFFRHLEPGGILIMPFMLLWQEGTALETDWIQDGEMALPEAGVVIRRWSRARFDPENQLEHTETRFEKIVEGDIITSEYHSRSPATRAYTQAQARQMYLQSGFRDLKFYSEFSLEPAREADRIFSVVGVKPVKG